MNLKKLFTTVAVFVLLIASSTFAQTFFVNNLTGNDANSGLSTAQAKATLNSAMIAAPSGSTISVQNTTVNYIEASPVITNNYTFTSTDGTPVIFNNALSIGSAGAVAITGIAATTNATITATGHGLINGNSIFIYGTGDATLDGKYFTVTVLSATQFTINNSTASTGSATGAFRVQGAVTFTGPFEFDGGLNLNCGTIANANNLTVKSPVYRTELGSITAGQLAYSGTVAFTYENVTDALAASGTTTITTGLEFPTTATTATDLSTKPTAGSLTLQLDQNRQINGILFTDAAATTKAAPIDLNTFTLTISGTNAHSVRSDVTNGTIAFIMDGGDASINAPAASSKLGALTATSSTSTARTLTIGANISTITSMVANSAATITSANTGAIGNITLNGSGAISTTNQAGGATAMAGAVLASSTSTGTITLNNAAAAAYKLTSITQSGKGNITFGGNVNAINVTGNVLLNTAFTYGLAADVAATTNSGWITFTGFPVTIGGTLTNSATFTGSTNQANTTNGQITFGASTVTVTGATLNNVVSTVTYSSAANGTAHTFQGDIVFANAANALTFAGVTNSAVLTSGTGSGGRILATGTAAVTATTLLNNSTYANANIDFSASTGIFTATSVTESGATTGGDILLGSGNVVGTTTVGVDFINSRGAAGADIIVGTAGSTGTIVANNINNSGAANITFKTTTSGGVTVTVGISQTGAGTTSFPNTTSAAFSIKNVTVTTGTLSLGAAAATTAAFTLNNVTISGGKLYFGDGTGAINVSVAVINPAGVFSLTDGTVDFGAGARAVTVATPNIYIGGLGTKVAFTQSTLTNLVIDQPIPNVTQNIYLGTLDQSFPGYLSVTNPAVIPAPYVIFQSAAGASGTNGNLYILNTGGAANGLTFNNGSAVVNFVQLNNARIYVGKNGTTNGGGFQNTSGYVTTNGGFVMMAAGTAVAQAVNAGAVSTGATFGNFGVQTSSGIANSVTFGAAGAVMAGDFYLASGDVNPANLFFNGPSPYPTIYRTEGTFSAPITVGNITGYINVTYYGSDKVTSNEVPTTKLWNLTVATTNGAKPGFGIIAMTGNITVNGTLTINANQALYTGVAPILTIAGASAVVNGYLVDPGTTNVYLAAATGTVFTGAGFLPSLQVNDGSLGNTVTGYTGLYSYGFGADGVWGGSGGNLDNFTVAAGNIVYQAGVVDAGSSLTVGFQNTGSAHFGNLTMNTALETYTQTTNVVMSGNISQTGGTIALGDYTLTHQGTAFTSNGTTANGSAITSTVNGGLIFPTTATTLTITGAADMIAANVSFAPTSNAANSNYSLAAGFNLTINGNVTLANSPDGTKGAVVDITNGRSLILGGNNVTVSSKSSFTAVGGTGILDLTNTAPNTLLTFTIPASSSVANLQLDGNVTLAGGITGSTLTATTSLVHNSGLLTFGSANLQIGNATAATFSRTGATATYSGDGYLIWNSTNAAGFSHSTVVAAGAMTINSLQLKTNFTLQNARALNIVKNLYLNGGSLTNAIAGGTTGYVFMGDATNVPLIQVVEPNDVVTNALQFVNANADYTFTGVGGNTITATVWPATATLARNVIVDITAAGILNIPARTINGDLTLTSGVLTWDSPTVVTIGSGSTITRTDVGSLNYDANGNLTTGTLTAPNVNLVYTPTATGTGVFASGIEYSEPVVINNFTMGTTALPATVTLGAAKTIAGAVTINNAASILNVNMNTTFSAAQNLAVGTINVLATKTLTLGAAATLPIVTGNVSTNFPLTIVGGHSAGTLTVGNDFTVGPNATLIASSNLVFVGATNATFTVPSGITTVGALTFNKTNNTNTVTLSIGTATLPANLTATANTTFTNGLFVTGSNTFTMFVPAFGAGQGFTRFDPALFPTNISHVVGNLAKTLFNAGGPGLGGSSEPRQVFPVGTLTKYRMAAVTFNPAFGLPTTPNATIKVNAFDGNPGGSVGLPIKDGVATGIDVARYPNFYWTIVTSPSDIGPSAPFDLELSAQDFTTFDAIANVRLIRRHGAVADVSNSWLLQGVNTSYDNSMNATTPTIIQRGANAGLRAGGAVFTFGMSSNLSVKNPIAKQWLVIPQGAKLVSLANVFQGNIGDLSFTAQSSNTAVVGAAIVGTSVQLTPTTVIGEAVITITATDVANNDFFAYSFDVDSRNTDVVTTEEIPTEFALSQNFPNPFNPTTNIKFALPKESNVTLKIYNILGEEVANLVNKVMPAGYHTVNFDATKLASGMYIYRIEAGSFVQVKKMLLMK